MSIQQLRNLTTLCYIEQDGKYLMLHRVKKENDINKDKWIGVGGHFEADESPEDCVLREVKEETGSEPSTRGNLEGWARQGVLLLNATLTVRKDSAGSHQKKGWEEFTDTVIRKISAEKEQVVFLLWGRFAHAKAGLIDASRHHILTAAHPSPLSAHRGFFGCGHFVETNRILSSQGGAPINW